MEDIQDISYPQPRAFQKGGTEAMKQLIIFIALKAIEIIGIVFVPWWVGHMPILVKILPLITNGKFDFWLRGLAACLATVSILIFIGAIVYLNWQWAGQLAVKG
jgi:hypothetical protein